MPVCIECGFPTQHLVVVESRNKALKRCSNCSRPCDGYLEYDAVQLVLCLILLVKEAFAHVLFNIPNISKKLVILVVLSIALESYVVLVTTEYASFKREHRDLLVVPPSSIGGAISNQVAGGISSSPASTAMQQLLYNLTGTSDEEASAAMLFGVRLLGSTLSDLVTSAIKPTSTAGVVHTGSAAAANYTFDGEALRNVNETLKGVHKILSSDITVQLVPVFKQHRSLVQVIDFTRYPTLMGYAFAEFAFVSLCCVWIAGLLYPRREHTLDAHVAVAGSGGSTASSSQSPSNGTFSTFMLVPCLAAGAKLLYVIFLVWQIPPYLMSIGEVAAVGWTHAGFRACGLSSRSALVLVVGSVLARCLVRSLTLWAPQLLMLEAMVLR